MNVPAASVTVAAPASDPDYLGFGNTVRLPDGTWRAFSRLGTVHVDKGVLVMASSPDGSAGSWSALSTILSDASLDLRDPCATVLKRGAHAGRVVLAFKKYDHVAVDSVLRGCWVIYSDDNCATWSTPYNLPDGFTEWSGCAASPCELDNGDILFAMFGSNIGDAGTHIRVLRSTDGGATAGNEVVLVTDPGTGLRYEEPQLENFGGSEVLALLRVREIDATINTYRTMSTNGGASWPAATYLFENRGAPRMKRLTSGNLVMVGRQPSRAYIQVSSEKGAPGTWSPAQQVGASDSYATMNYAGIDEYPDGSVGVLYAIEAVGGASSALKFKRIYVVAA